jgi:tetratricopeptide (TPR) repeat protein
MASSDSPTPSPRRKRRRWRWHTPPALTLESRALEGSAILELRADPLGLALWEAAQDVYLWGRAEPESRRELFSPSAGDARAARVEGLNLEGAPRRAFDALARMVSSPARVREETVVGACRELARWGARTAQPAVALEFARAAAIAGGADARAALELAWTARAQGETALAEAWFRRTIVLGRRAGDWESYAEAFLGIAGVLRRRGDLEGARQHLVRASRACRRHALPEIRARVLHDLQVAAAEAGAFDEAVTRGRRALRAYGRGHPHLPALILDISRMWIGRGAPGMARPVLAALVRRLDESPLRVAAVGLLGRASALVGDREAFGRCAAELGTPAEGLPGEAARAWIDLAVGASALGEEDPARRLAATAEAHLAEEAGRVLRSLEGDVAAGAIDEDYLPSEEEGRLQRDVMRAIRRLGD